ncbi:MAG: CapA family protein [Acidobacteriota bacterium]
MTRRTLLSLAGAMAGRETRLLFGGDVLLCRYIGRMAREKHEPALPFRDLAGLLSGADIAFVNLESPFSDRGKPVDRGMMFRAEPEMIAGLKAAGIDIVSTANNHARDCGGYGIGYTLQWLAENGIASVGTAPTGALAHQGTVLTRNGLRFGFLAYAQDQANGNYKDLDERICDMDVARMQQDVAAMKSRADVIAVSMHGGVEYWTRVHPLQTKFARAAIDAGARVVAGHHPHVVQRWERYGEGVIFYSLGNLVFDQFDRKATREGLLAEVVFSGTEIARVNAIPVEIVNGIPRV